MFKKLLSLALALIMVLALGAGLAACNKDPDAEATLTESPLPAVELQKDFDIPADFKVGFILLHDELSTYDLNFINAVNTIQKAAGLTDAQVILKTNIPEGNECYVAAKDLVDQGCSLIFADSFGHESFLIDAAKKYTDGSINSLKSSLESVGRVLLAQGCSSP